MADIRGAVLNRSVLPSGGVRRSAPRAEPADLPHPPGLPVRGARQVTATLTDLAGSARQEVLVFDDPGGCPGKGGPGHLLEFAAVLLRSAGELAEEPRSGGCGPGGPPGRGRRTAALRIRWIVPRDGPARHPYPPLPYRFPGRARQTDSVPFPVIVVDRAVATVPLDLHRHSSGLLLIRDPVVVRVLVRIHQAWWENGEDLRAAVVPSPGGLPRQLRPVLDALLAGLTDEAAAARLNMSGRTYSRRVGELLAALGTTSRFRAGTEAARLGWV